MLACPGPWNRQFAGDQIKAVIEQGHIWARLAEKLRTETEKTDGRCYRWSRASAHFRQSGNLREARSVRIPSFVVSCCEARRANDGKVSARVPG